ncbi:MAG: hypothetical protein NZ699_04480 [Roseiflexus sp.]|nr:hypothetical protein [Roseiflexus sp.]MCS7288369.1 hypothetical protein [Roseiflexus sp.]MDW8146519.1 hypothetical protein [Roseiflexaceae bacterium]MDW8231202.1 hypothetical protein [Roseiflexaceae bacterium]
MENILAAGDLERGPRELRNPKELLLLDQQIAIFVSVAPETIVSPKQQRSQHIRTESIGQASGAYSAVVYYAPSIPALLVQHTVASLGAPTLVRERLRGAFEPFRISPADMVQRKRICSSALSISL